METRECTHFCASAPKIVRLMNFDASEIIGTECVLGVRELEMSSNEPSISKVHTRSNHPKIKKSPNGTFSFLVRQRGTFHTISFNVRHSSAQTPNQSTPFLSRKPRPIFYRLF